MDASWKLLFLLVVMTIKIQTFPSLDLSLFAYLRLVYVAGEVFCLTRE